MQLSLCIISIPALETGMIFIWASLFFLLPLPLPLNLEFWQSIQATSTFFATFSTDNLLKCLLMKNDKKGQSAHLSPLSSPPYPHFGLLILVHVLAGNPHPHSSGFSLLITSAASKWFCLMDLVALTTDVFTAAINSFSGGNLYSGIARCEFAFCGTFVKPEEAQSVVRWSLQMVLRYWPEPCWNQTNFYGNLEPLGTWHLNIWWWVATWSVVRLQSLAPLRY